MNEREEDKAKRRWKGDRERAIEMNGLRKIGKKEYGTSDGGKGIEKRKIEKKLRKGKQRQ